MTASPRTTLLVVNRNKPDADHAADELRSLIKSHGTLAGEIDSAETKTVEQLPAADLIVVLGGDGTLLGEGRRFAGVCAQILGVNVGKLGFLAEFDVQAVRAQARTLFGGGELVTREVPLLDVWVERKSGERVHLGRAMNEAVVTAGEPYRVIELAVAIDGIDGPVVRGDGLIVSTALGSTAYNVSAGGPIVHPEVGAMVITPIAAHSLAFRPIVVPGTTTVELRTIQINAATTLVLDGQIMERLGEGDRVQIRRADECIQLVVNEGVNYWDTLVGKLHWAKQPTSRKS